MSSENINNYVRDSDKCPKCGAVKVFSALTCPSCGTSYTVARVNNSLEGIATSQTGTLNNFDLNASFSAFKKSLEQVENGQLGDKQTGVNRSNFQTVNSESPKDATSILSRVADLDPITKKVQEMSKQNAVAITPDDAGKAIYSAMPTQTVQNLVRPGVPSLNNTPYSSVNGPMYSNPNNNQYSSPYATSYNNPTFNSSVNSIPEKSGKGGKIFAAVIVLIFLGMIGFAVYKYRNSDKNESGISYSSGKTEYSIYTNEWANVKINCKEELKDYTYMVYSASFQSNILNIERSVKSKNGEVEVNFVGAKEMKVGSQTAQVPTVIMMTITDNSVNSKLFGIDMEEFFNESDIRSTDLPAGYSLTRENDMLLCGHSYRTYCISGPYDANSNLSIYMCARVIGNRLVLFYLYDIPDVMSLSDIKGYFMN